MKNLLCLEIHQTHIGLLAIDPNVLLSLSGAAAVSNWDL